MVRPTISNPLQDVLVDQIESCSFRCQCEQELLNRCPGSDFGKVPPDRVGVLDHHPIVFYLAGCRWELTLQPGAARRNHGHSASKGASVAEFCQQSPKTPERSDVGLDATLPCSYAIAQNDSDSSLCVNEKRAGCVELLLVASSLALLTGVPQFLELIAGFDLLIALPAVAEQID